MIGMNWRGKLRDVSGFLYALDSTLVTFLAADKKAQEAKKTKGNESDDSDARPKKKAPPKGKAPAKPPAKNGKVAKKPKTNGKR